MHPDPRFVPRTLDLAALARRKSLFLLGPRQTGKSALVRYALPTARLYDLLDAEVFVELSRRPKRIEEEIDGRDSVIVIDEIQKLPVLLDEVHRLIERRGVRFVLTGSSARKLRRGGNNLLGGRAVTRTLHPLTLHELGAAFDLSRALDVGTIPSIYFSTAPRDDLRSYAATYLREEIAAEAATRNVPAFGRFLDVAALSNGTMLNYTQVASDAQVAVSTVRQYYEILEDTLIAQRLAPWTRTRSRKAIATAKHYFFDVGLVRQLQGRTGLSKRTPEFGEALETYVHHELRSYVDYTTPTPLAYWRSLSNFEVDFILADCTAIEVKGKDPIGDRDLRGLRALREEKLLKRYVVVTLEQRARRIDGIDVLPWREFLTRLWAGEFVK